MKKTQTNEASRASISPELVKQARGGDQAAFAELYEQTSAALYRSVRSMVRDEELAWDVLQDSYLRAWQGLDKLKADEAFLPWLRRIAVSVTATKMAQRHSLCFTELGGEEDWEPDIPDLNIDSQPEPALDRKETARLVREILGSLPEAQQMIVGMHYYEDMPIKDIAETLHVAPGTVKAQLCKGRRKIEAEVRALEKQGVKLYGLSPLPFLLALLRKLEPAAQAEQKTLSAVLSAAPAASGSAMNLTAMTAGQAFLHGLGAKLLAGALALALIGGGLWAGSKLLKDRQPGPEDVLPVPSDVLPVPTQPTERIEISVSTEPSVPGTVEAPVITMPALPEPTTEPTEPQLSFETAEEAYDYVLEQYRQAVNDPDYMKYDHIDRYEEVQGWIVAPMIRRASLYSDDDSSLFASFRDIDGNGVPEMILSARFSSTEYSGDYAAIFAIYTWDGAVPVSLLPNMGRESYVSVLADGTVRLVWNGYYASSTPIWEYRLDGDRCVLELLDDWSYTCTEEGERSFELLGADGTVLTPAEFYARHGETVHPVQWGDEPFVSVPGTAESPAVVDLEGVPRQSADRGPSLPRITLEGEAFEAFNEKIRTQYLEPMQAYAAAHPGVFESWYWYGWSLNDDVLCVWIFDGSWPGMPPELVCRFSVPEGRELTEDELLARFDMSRADYEAGMIARLYGAFVRLNGDAAAGRGADQEIRWIYENREELSAGACLLLDRSGELVCLARVPSVETDVTEYYMIPVLQ